METIFKRWWLLLLNGILFLILGVISLAYPVTALFSVAVYIGVVALVAGIGSIVVALSNMRVRSWGWRLLEGVIDVIFGLLMLGNPLLSAAMIPVLIGIWVFVRGLMYVADSLAWRRRGSGDWSRYLIVGILLLIVLITWVNGAERRIPVQYAKRQVGRKMYGGQSSTLPMKVNMSGVLPIIFAQSIAMIPSTIAAFCKQPAEGTFWYGFLNAIDTKSVLYMIFYFLMIIAFSYFYATIQFNPVEISNNLKKNGGFIPGFRPGKPTTDFIKKVLNKVTLFGAIYLGVVAILPLLIGKIVGNSALSIGGTSVIIVVGVALETVQALESQMLMRQYKGFLE